MESALAVRANTVGCSVEKKRNYATQVMLTPNSLITLEYVRKVLIILNTHNMNCYMP